MKILACNLKEAEDIPPKEMHPHFKRWDIRI
jgi:hypothetical protein